MRGCRKRSSADLLMVWVAAEKGKNWVKVNAMSRLICENSVLVSFLSLFSWQYLDNNIHLRN